MLNDALPIAIELSDTALAAEVTTHVESRLGWQVVAPGPFLPVRLVLADAVQPGRPTVVISRGSAEHEVRGHLRDGALDVLDWPGDAERLLAAVPADRVLPPADRVIVVAAMGSRVGASTVALALGATLAWQGCATLVWTDGEGCRLAGGPTNSAAGGPVLGVPGLRVADRLPQVPDPTLDVVIVDRGSAGSGHLLVATADHGLIRGAPYLSADTPMVVVAGGGLHPGEVRRLVGDRLLVDLPRSFRVARAGLRGRVPVALPGRYLSTVGRILKERPRLGFAGPSDGGSSQDVPVVQREDDDQARWAA